MEGQSALQTAQLPTAVTVPFRNGRSAVVKGHVSLPSLFKPKFFARLLQPSSREATPLCDEKGVHG